ncbi:MAG: hypothetical protein ACM3OC_03480 [Deltaproteobacteria bacterium]
MKCPPGKFRIFTIGHSTRPLYEFVALRRARKDSVNQGWRNSSFRGYADYIQTDDFLEGSEG